MTHPVSSSTESEALRIGDPVGLDSRFHGNDRGEMRDPFPPVILNRKQSASDWGSSPAWIPVCTGMTEGRCGIHSLPSSSTESKALRIGDLVLPGFPLARE